MWPSFCGRYYTWLFFCGRYYGILHHFVADTTHGHLHHNGYTTALHTYSVAAYLTHDAEDPRILSKPQSDLLMPILHSENFWPGRPRVILGTACWRRGQNLKGCYRLSSLENRKWTRTGFTKHPHHTNASSVFSDSSLQMSASAYLSQRCSNAVHTCVTTSHHYYILILCQHLQV